MTDTIFDLKNQASALLREQFGKGERIRYVYVPGRVNLIGEHIDYHNLAVLPMAIGRGICIAYRSRDDDKVQVLSKDQERVSSFEISQQESAKPGSWENYLLAAKAVALNQWKIKKGIDAAVSSNLPSAAGLSSSTALMAGLTISLLQANGIEPSIPELMNVLPEGEQFVGTRGGGMDHAAVLSGHAGCALQVSFSPLCLSPVRIPPAWRFLVAHSLTTAEKSGSVRERYNALRLAGNSALKRLNFPSYAAVIQNPMPSTLQGLTQSEQMVFRHVYQEGLRVHQAVDALRANDFTSFGLLLNESHRSLRDQLQISNAAVDTLVETALEVGAAGARMTGAGFGGCVIMLCNPSNVDSVRENLLNRYYAKQLNRFEPNNHLFVAEPSAGALIE